LEVPGKKELVHVGIEDARLLKIMRHGVLGQKGRLEPDFGADPFAFTVWSVRRMVATSAAAELWAEFGALDLIELLDFLPGGVADGAGDVDFQVKDAHVRSPRRDRDTQKLHAHQWALPSREIPRRAGENAGRISSTATVSCAGTIGTA